MEDKNGVQTFGTLKTQGIHSAVSEGMSGSMEDYLEMIYRIAREGKAVRVRDLAGKLGVSPSSVSRMSTALRSKGFVNFEKYGYITLTEEGRVSGEYLYHRHEVVNSFLCMLNKSDDELRQTEQIEHYLNEITLFNMERVVKTGKLA